MAKDESLVDIEGRAVRLSNLGKVLYPEAAFTKGQMIDYYARIAPALRVCARDPEDGIIEAVELPLRRFVLAVQWHPENQAPGDSGQRNLFESFAATL